MFEEYYRGKVVQELTAISKLNLENIRNQRYANLLESLVKDGAYYCYCAYVLRISRYSDFLSPMLTNAGIFLRSLKLSGERRP